ncbi:MAG TPA: HAMP domain-containing sensor histidine kinase [Stellaceae bacterium]|nr:HAMP domain-containing sensor histidine kinase [Stellaceae bacterium]
MPASDTAGPRRAERRRLDWAWSLATKTALLAVIYSIVPIILYGQFRSAYDESQKLLLRSVRDEGRAISESLLPWLKTADSGALPELGQHLARFAGEVTTIKVLFAPARTSGGFYYVGSWPLVQPPNLAAERETLARQGVLAHLARDCRGEMPFSLLYDRPTGGAEIVTAVTPLLTPAGCWAVVSSFSADAFPSAHLGEPYWATPIVRLAAAIYLAMAVITFSTLIGVRRGLSRFARRARRIREGGADAGSFGDRAHLPELADVAAEFDRMVEALHRSAAEIRQAAEDNAHAFKTPIAIIRHSLEPLRRALPPGNPRAQRAFGVLESALDRLDGLVASARRLDEATADLLAKPQALIDLERVIGRMVQTRSAVMPSRELTIKADLTPGILVLGSEEMIETVLENLIDNAVSFSPPGGEILVRLTRDGRSAHIAVSDRGPGIPPERLERIFDRYHSERRPDETADAAASSYFGIGLWIARRNVEAMGGTIVAENRTPHGLTVHVRLPRARGRG